MGLIFYLPIDLPKPYTCLCQFPIEKCMVAVPQKFLNEDGTFDYSSVPPWEKVKASTVCACGRNHAFLVTTTSGGELSVTPTTPDLIDDRK